MSQPRELRELGLEPVDLRTSAYELVGQLRIRHEVRINGCDHAKTPLTSDRQGLWVVRLR